jgi:hypothetical protein
MRTVNGTNIQVSHSLASCFGPWGVYYDCNGYRVVNVETGKSKYIGKLMAKRTNFLTKASRVAHERNLNALEKDQREREYRAHMADGYRIVMTLTGTQAYLLVLMGTVLSCEGEEGFYKLRFGYEGLPE